MSSTFRFGSGALLADEALALARVERLARVLDTLFRIPGTRWRMGLDGLLGLVPGVGDAVGAALGAYILYEAWRVGAPSQVIARMLLNLGIDSAVGSVPVLGDIFDVAFKSHRRNADLLREHLRGRAGRPSAPRVG